MTKRALVVGIGDNHAPWKALPQAPAVAERIAELLRTNPDGTPNWDVTSLIAHGPDSTVTNEALNDAISDLFYTEPRDDWSSLDLLLYYTGHADSPTAATFFVASNTGPNHQPIASVQNLAADIGASKARSVTVMLDCCFSGNLSTLTSVLSTSTSNVAILAACSKDEKAWAHHEQGSVFSRYLTDGLGEDTSLEPGPVSVSRLCDYIEKNYHPDLLAAQEPEFSRPRSSVGRRVELVVIPERGSRDGHRPSSAQSTDDAIIADPYGEARVSQHGDEVELAWLSEVGGTPEPWQRFRLAPGERAVTATRAEPWDAFVVLATASAARVLRVHRTGVVADAPLPVAGPITTARFGAGAELGTLTVERPDGTSTVIDVTSLVFEGGAAAG